jgi:EpsI family protein
MHASAFSTVAAATLGLLAAQGVAVHLTLSGGILPPAPDLRRFPQSVAGWHSAGEAPGSAAAAAALHTDAFLQRTYVRPDGHRNIDFLVAWFQSQRGGAQQPHSPKVCLPGAGWVPVAISEMTVETAAGPLRLNRYTVRNRAWTSEVLYWYQTPRRVMTSEWAAKLYVVVDGVRDRRTDTALVRVTVTGRGVEDAVEFVRAAYPSLRETLPR